MCKATSQLPLLLFPHCLLSKSLSATAACVHAWPCEELPTPPSLGPKILPLLSLTLLPAVMSLSLPSSLKSTHYIVLLPAALRAKLSQNPSSLPSFISSCRFLSESKSRCHFTGMCVFAYLKDDTHICISPVSGGDQEKPGCSSVSCSKTRPQPVTPADHKTISVSRRSPTQHT